MLGKHYSKDSEGNTIIAEVELLQSKVGNLYYRPKTSDKTMLKESFSDYPTINCKDRVVMDCGSNIGGFILKACQDGAKSITSYEPEPLNLEFM